MKILITGGAGFVGSSLARLFKQKYEGYEIVCLDNLLRRGSELNISLLKEKGITFIHGDVRNPEDLESVGAYDVLIEASAEPSVMAGYGTSPLPLINTNLMGAVNCFESARRNSAVVIFLSTSRVYPIEQILKQEFKEEGERFVLRIREPITAGITSCGINEAFSLEGTRSMYGATKLSAELILKEYTDMYGIKSVINRCGVIAGPGQFGKTDQGILALWAARHFWKTGLEYIGFGGKGLQVRDMLHPKDLFDLIDMQISGIDELNGEIFNVGGGANNSVSLCELTQMCEESTANSINIGSQAETRYADIPWYISDISKVTKKTGWKPSISVRQMVDDTVSWIREDEERLKGIFL